MKTNHPVSFRAISFLCALLILCSLPLTAFAASGPKAYDLIGINDEVEYPRSDNWLSDYETMYVQTKYGVRAYLRFEPTEDSDYFDFVYEEDLVTVLARQNGYSLVKTTEGHVGWVTSSVLVYHYGSSSQYNSASSTDYSAAPSYSDMIGCNEGVAVPRTSSWLAAYETMFVQTKYGVRAYLRFEPTEDSDYYEYVYEEEAVTILARQNGYSLVKTSDGKVGWVSSSVLVYQY